MFMRYARSSEYNFMQHLDRYRYYARHPPAAIIISPTLFWFRTQSIDAPRLIVFLLVKNTFKVQVFVGSAESKMTDNCYLLFTENVRD